uniref:Uncharacterized protein n=1 Tax=Chlorobium chlorochromatii (strain CaD3) TaxID=340177 RepID=Q3APM7_CHLCH
MDNTTQIGIQYSGFRFKSFFFQGLFDEQENEAFEFQTSLDIRTGSDRVIIGVMVLVNRKSDAQTYAKAETESLFLVEGVERTKDESCSLIIPQVLLITLVSLAISTSRGALLVKGAGSFLEKIPMPIVDPKVFVSEIQFLGQS